MKKIILIAVISLVSKFSEAQMSFGLQVGANFGMGKFKYDNAFFDGSVSHDQSNKMKIGALGGFIAEIPIGSSLAFRPELNFLQEGTKHTFNVNYGVGNGELTQKITLNYIQLPLNVVYKLSLGEGNAFFGLGPSLQFGISGKDKLSSSTNPSDPQYNKTIDVKFDGKKLDDINNGNGDDKGHLKRFDVGINVLAGYKLGMGVFAKIGYSHGFMELNPDKDNVLPSDRSSYKNSGFNVSVGYMIGGGGGSKKKK